MKKNKLIKLIIISLSVTTIVNVKGIEPITTVLTAGIGMATKEAGSAAINYWYRSEGQDKIILKRYLHSHSYQSTVAHGCNENFEENCHLYAELLKKARIYNTAMLESMCVKYQKDYMDAPIVSEECTQSFFETLRTDEQEKVLKLERELVMQFTNPSDYQEELFCLHEALNRKS